VVDGLNFLPSLKCPPPIKQKGETSTAGDDACTEEKNPNFSTLDELGDMKHGLELLRQAIEDVRVQYAKGQYIMKRREAFEQFVNDSGTTGVVTRLVGTCAAFNKNSSIEFDKNGNAKFPVCTDNSGALSSENLERLFKRKLAAALALPFAGFLDARKEILFSAYLQHMVKISGELTDADTILVGGYPNNDLREQLMHGFWTLQRLANGVLTEEERKTNDSKALSDFVAFFEGFAKDVEAANKRRRRVVRRPGW
jgi:hypothetical protein